MNEPHISRATLFQNLLPVLEEGIAFNALLQEERPLAIYDPGRHGRSASKTVHQCPDWRSGCVTIPWLVKKALKSIRKCECVAHPTAEVPQPETAELAFSLKNRHCTKVGE
jgi:hypothetical protein